MTERDEHAWLDYWQAELRQAAAELPPPERNRALADIMSALSPEDQAAVLRAVVVNRAADNPPY